MPTLADLRSRFGFGTRGTVTPLSGDESLVADVRGKLSPAQMVEQKLRQALGASQTVEELAGVQRRKKSRP
jgi:hypothetical protein